MRKTENQHNEYMISKSEAVNEILKHQRSVLERLKNTIEKPFKDEWEYLEWKEEVIELQLSQYTHNALIPNSKAIWHNLIEGNATPEMRQWIAKLMFNHIGITFAQARMELAEREANSDTD